MAIFDPQEIPREWGFTFGRAHAHPDNYVVFDGTFMQARTRMLAAYGSRWCGQYTMNEIVTLERQYGITRYHPTPDELGVIDVAS